MIGALKMTQIDVEEETHIPFDQLSSYSEYGINSVCAVAEFVISLATILSSYRHSYNSSPFA